MNNRRLGMIWERESRVFLKDKFNTDLIFKLINPEQIDWFVFYGDNGKKLALVESKFTKKDKYYPFENQKKRNQINRYFKVKSDLIGQGYECEFYFLIKKGKTKEVFFEKIDQIGDLKKSY